MCFQSFGSSQQPIERGVEQTKQNLGIEPAPLQFEAESPTKYVLDCVKKQSILLLFVILLVALSINVLVCSWVLTSSQPLRANHTFKIPLHQFRTQVTKSQVYLILCCNVKNQPAICQSMNNSKWFSTSKKL